MNSIFFNKIEDAKCIKIYLHEKIDAKILNKALIKIGLTSVSIEIKNLENYENYYYLAFNNNIKTDFKCINIFNSLKNNFTSYVFNLIILKM